VDAPQKPDADASASHPAGPAAPGQASAFRRALDKQAAAPEPGSALVPSGAHDLTMPLDLRAVRAALAFSPTTDSHTQTQTQVETQIPAQPQPQSHPPLPAVRTPTLIQRAESAAVVVAQPPEPPRDAGSDDSSDGGDGRDGGSKSPARLPTAVWISAFLAAIAGAALILVDQGHGSDPLAPSALPAKASSQAPASYASHPVTSPSPAHSPSTRPNQTTAPSKSAGPSTSPSTSVSPGGSGLTLPMSLNQGSTGSFVVDIQRRLSDLGLLTSFSGSSSFRDSGWTLWEVQQQRGPSPDVGGYYGKATDYAIIAFKRHFLNNDEGPLPSGGCDAQTYVKLWQETASFTS